MQHLCSIDATVFRLQTSHADDIIRAFPCTAQLFLVRLMCGVAKSGAHIQADLSALPPPALPGVGIYGRAKLPHYIGPDRNASRRVERLKQRVKTVEYLPGEILPCVRRLAVLAYEAA